MKATRAANAIDDRFMGIAISLARRGLGRVWPNPTVGTVIVDSDGHIVGRGRTQDGGRPHAETEALAQAGAKAKGATVYTTLEPCSHHGKTGPCADALVKAGVARVVSAVEDPDHRVSGRGHATLTAAGITLRTGVRGKEAAAVNEGFLSRVALGRPLITLKLATTLDGKIALADGQSKWITGERARAHTHLERAEHDAVMVGIGTALADDPELTCRLPGVTANRTVRIVVDSKARLSPSSKLAESARHQPVWLLTSDTAATQARDALAAKGIRILTTQAAPQGLDLAAALKTLGDEGLTRVLVEGGATLATSLVNTGLVDRLLWYRAPTLMGDGHGAVGSLTFTNLVDLPRFKREETLLLGDDVLETYRPAP